MMPMPANNDSANHWLRLHPQDSICQSITPDNRGLAYGDGFFTTMAVMDGKVLWLAYHQQRLISHAQALQFAIDSEQISSHLQTQAEQLQQGILKLIITRAMQSVRGYGFGADSSGRANEVWLKTTAIKLTTTEISSLPNKQTVFIQPALQAVCLNSQLSCLPPTLAGLKTLNRLDNVLASAELQDIKATASNIAEGLLRDINGSWIEGTMSNVFYQLDPTQANNNHPNHSDYLTDYLTQGQWYTPSMSQSGVAGVMRQVFIDAFEPTNSPVVIRALTEEDLPQLSKLFFCNAVRGIMPVASLTLLSGEVVGLS